MLQNEEQELNEFSAAVRQILAAGNPNPNRTDCARFKNRIKALAWHAKLGPDLEVVLEHISHCSPCFKDHHKYKTQYKLYQRCKRVVPYVAAAVVLLLLGIRFHALWKRQTSTVATGQDARPSTSVGSRESQVARIQSLQEVTLTLESNLRGDDGGYPINLDLPRGRLQLTLQLPTGARPGRYLVRLSQGHEKPLLQTEGLALTNERNVSILRIDQIDTSKIIPGKYQLSVKRETLDWSDFEVQVK